MSDAFPQNAYCIKSLLATFALVFLSLGSQLQAAVTWDGTEGIGAWLNTNGCTAAGCHDGTNRDFRTFETATQDIVPTPPNTTSAQELADRISTRLNLPATDLSCMPQGACETVSDSFVVAWKNDGALENALPSVQTNDATSVDRTSAILNGSVSANGRDTWYVFEWGLDDEGTNFSNQIPLPPAPTSSTNGGLNPQNVNQTLSDLTCDTGYQFRLGATNDDPSIPPISYNYDGDPKFFTTTSCNFPVVRFGGSQVTGVGQTVSIPVILEGDASTVYEYPINIQYEVSGTAASDDFDLVSGTLTINSPDTSGDLIFNITGNTNAPEDETIVIDVTEATNDSGDPNATVPLPSTHTVIIAGTDTVPNSPPLQASQADLNTYYVYTDQGIVTITANSGTGQFSYDWSATDPRLPGGATGNQYTFDPLDPSVPPPGLASGAYVVSVAIEGSQETTHQTITLWLVEGAPLLSCGSDDDEDGNGICNEIEGYGDFDFDGLPDYQDPIGDPQLLNGEVSSTGGNQAHLIKTTAGLSLALNDTAFELVARGKATGAKISADDVVDDPDSSAISSVFDFQIRGLSDIQRTAQVVIPLDNPMPPNARYRKLIDGVWSDFVETSTDRIRSARSDENSGECPPPGDLAYEDGLIPFNACLELTLTDGGPNDGDSEANDVIKDPGAVVLPASVASGSPVSPDASSSPGGAGALNWWWLLMLTPLFWLQYRSRQGQAND